MSDQDVFASQSENQDQGTQGDNGTPQSQEPSSQDVFTDKLMSIKNEDGTPKYPDVASALDSIPHAQGHISTLEKEAAELRDKLAQEKAARELLAKQVGNTQSPAQQGLTEEQVAQIARQAQEDALKASAEQQNVKSVNETFSKLYGEKAVEVMQTVAADTGMPVSQIRELAKTSPQAVYKLAGITAPDPTIPPKTPMAGGQGDNFTPPQKPEVPKSVMGGSNTADLIANWKAAGEIVKSQQT